MRNCFTPLVAIVLMACGSTDHQDPALQTLTCTAERAYNRAIAGVREKMSSVGQVNAYEYSADQVTEEHTDYTYWVTTTVVVGGARRYAVEGGLHCLDSGVIALGWLDIHPVE